MYFIQFISKAFILELFFCPLLLNGVYIQEIIEKFPALYIKNRHEKFFIADFGVREVLFMTYKKNNYTFALPFPFLPKKHNVVQNFIKACRTNKFFYDFHYPTKEILENKLGYFSHLEKNRKDLIYRLESTDGSPWTGENNSIPLFINFSHRIISRCHDNATRIHLQTFSDFEDIQYIEKNYPSFFSENQLLKFDKLFKDYIREQEAVIEAYNRHDIPTNMPATTLFIQDFNNLTDYYSLRLNRKLTDLSHLWFPYQYFTYEICKKLCLIIRFNSHIYKNFYIGRVLTLLCKFSETRYMHMCVLDSLSESKELFLSDLIYCITSYITHAITFSEECANQKLYANLLISIIYDYYLANKQRNAWDKVNNHYEQLKSMCNEDKSKAILFKPLIQKRLLRSYIRKVLEGANSPFLIKLGDNISVAGLIADQWEPTEEFMTFIRKSKNTNILNNLFRTIKNH